VVSAAEIVQAFVRERRGKVAFCLSWENQAAADSLVSEGKPKRGGTALAIQGDVAVPENCGPRCIEQVQQDVGRPARHSGEQTPASSATACSSACRKTIGAPSSSTNLDKRVPLFAGSRPRSWR